MIVGYYMVWKDLYGAGTFNTAKRILDNMGIDCSFQDSIVKKATLSCDDVW